VIDGLTPEAIAARRAFGHVIRVRRKALGLSQERLADRAGCDRQSINRVENAAYSPSLDRVFPLATALGIDVGQLFVDVAAELGKQGQPADTAAARALASVIHTRREQRGLTLPAAAELAGIEVAVLRDIEAAELVPDAAELDGLARVLGTTPDRLRHRAALLAAGRQGVSA
jgi:putative transcriptional regulator